ncbi:ubiquitin-like domain-containing protein, partial [Streptomyces sp. NPDC006356]
MSNAQYETYGPSPAHRPPGYGGFAPDSVRTLAYGVGVAPSYEGYGGYEGYEGRDLYGGGYEDTYRPAYEESETAYEPVVRPRSGRRAAHRRRARLAERGDGPMRRLVPQALVVAFLAGGTSAFVAKDKAIELNVDGKPRTLHTFADDVTELLDEEGVEVGAHDAV